MTIDLSLITKLNNQGADSISSNNFASSIKNLAAALKATHGALSSQRPQNTQHDVAETSCFPACLLSIDRWMTSSIENNSEPSMPTNMNDLTDDSFLFCYNHPIYIPDDVTATLDGRRLTTTSASIFCK
jgi:hypothetical protein